MKKINNITFKNVNEYDNNLKHWKGFQVKVFALYYSNFDEIILCDADVTFFKNPELIFEDNNYIRTGTYFFKDLEKWTFSNLTKENKNKFNSLNFFNQRKNFIKKLLPNKTDKFPKEWNYIYEVNIPTVPVKEALQESGVVFINKNIQNESLNHIFKLNDNHDETYKYVWGDKETFWLGCVMANKDYYFNDSSGIIHNKKLSHFYNNELFWIQK